MLGGMDGANRLGHPSTVRPPDLSVVDIMIERRRLPVRPSRR